MDYKYIEQLLDRYFDCETSLGEEQVLRAFFAQENVPVSLLPYREIFLEQTSAKEEALGSDFDQRILAIIDEQKAQKPEPVKVKARIVKMSSRLRPLYKAAACVAIVLAIGQAAQMPYSAQRAEQENIARSLQKPDIRKDENAVAQGDSAAKMRMATPEDVVSTR